MESQTDHSPALERGVRALLSARDSIPRKQDVGPQLDEVAAAAARGYFLPDEEERVRYVYARYLGLRAALLETLGELEVEAGRNGTQWQGRLPHFIAAFAAACMVMRADRFLADVAADCPVLWKKLDEEDPRDGIPRKSFTAIFKAVSDPRNALRFLTAADFYLSHRAEIQSFAKDPVLGPVVDLLAREEEEIEQSRRQALKRFWRYRWFSFLRRHRSAWKQVMFGIFEISGRAVADLRQPGVKPRSAPKRIHPELRRDLLRGLGPGDVLVTRHDDALSNLFLPGFWPHAALYLGTSGDLEAMGIEIPAESPADGWFLESKKDGVRIRPAAETLEVDAFVALQNPLSGESLAEAIRRAASHAGKPYDFLFDFRTADRMVCTEVIYRGFHGIGPVKFHLKECGGRLCLPAEELLSQALESGYRIVAAGGLDDGGLKTGPEAEVAFLRTVAGQKP